MSATLFDGVTITAEAALTTATSEYGAWESGLWDSALWGPDENWTDVSAYLRAFATSRKFAREVQIWGSGSASLVLSNQDGRFSEDNPSSPYTVAGVSGVRPLRPVRINATYAGVTYPVMRMYATDWIESYGKPAPTGQGVAIVTVPCSDERARIAAVTNLAQASAGASELSGARLHRWLNSAGHAGNRDIDTGTVTMQATTLEGNVAGALDLVAASEGGTWYVEADGSVVGRRQYALVEDTRSAEVQATFGDGGSGEIPYQDIRLAGSGDLVTNIANYQRVGGAVQTASDATSRALYGDRTDNSPNMTRLVCETDGQVAQLAAWKIARHKDRERRVDTITVNPRRDPATMYPVVLGLKVRDLVLVKRRPPGGHTIEQYCHIAGIAHQVTKRPSRWLTTYTLWSATPYQAFTASRWDVGTWGADPTDATAARWFY